MCFLKHGRDTEPTRRTLELIRVNFNIYNLFGNIKLSDTTWTGRLIGHDSEMYKLTLGVLNLTVL
jgi:hypothetical protein